MSSVICATLPNSLSKKFLFVLWLLSFYTVTLVLLLMPESYLFILIGYIFTNTLQHWIILHYFTLYYKITLHHADHFVLHYLTLDRYIVLHYYILHRYIILHYLTFIFLLILSMIFYSLCNMYIYTIPSPPQGESDNCRRAKRSASSLTIQYSLYFKFMI